MSLIKLITQQTSNFVIVSRESNNKFFYETTWSAKYSDYNVRVLLNSRKLYIGYIRNGVFYKVSNHYSAVVLKWYIDNETRAPHNLKAFIHEPEKISVGHMLGNML